MTEEQSHEGTGWRRARSWLGRRFAPQSRLGAWLWRLRLHGPFPLLRTRRLATRLLGPQYDRSRRRLEIDITYACNLACDNCNRSVPQAPSSARLTAEQIGERAAEWEREGVRWERIRLLGGEPTLHPEFFAILDVLRRWRDRASPDTRIEVTTNGFGPHVASALARIPGDVAVNNSAKEATGAGPEMFASFNLAPRDLPAYADADFANGCRILKDCGMGLAPSGYYPCAVAAGIDRVLGLGAGRASLPPAGDELRDQMKLFCSWCGHFKRELPAPLGGQASSPSWEAAYAAWRLRRRAPRREGAPGSFPAAPERP
ncbi:MAG: radical SAM protein [Alphaproteobacteria bacterium]|nr:radical SAM protein [Alphaproteobacteria bacterium]MBV9372715.1 radical SAM protein [Alphaproteobacteria bacterium]MBV9900660.1 radical SAM protein [Alphaproteobacteria bacterium]